MISDDLRPQAAELAFAMLRFTEPAAHLMSTESHREGSEAGSDSFVFSPSWRKTAKEEVVPFLLSHDCPLMILPTIYRGSATLLVLDEVAGESRTWFQKTLENQVSALHHYATQLSLTPDSRILLEFADEEHLVSFGTLQEWAQRYCVGVGWNLGPCGDSRADARLMLIGPNGLRSWGASCPLRPHE
jgi:hypothetical protein